MTIPFTLPEDEVEPTGLQRITDHVAAAVGRLIEQYRDKANVVALVSIFAARAQVLEDALWDLYLLRWVGSATGAALDNLGAIVGQPRQSADDEVYRLYVQARIRLNRSSGTTEDLLAVLGLVFSGEMRLHDRPPAGFRLELVGAVDADHAAAYLALLRAARAAGVYGELEWSAVDDADTLRLDAASPQALDGGKLSGLEV
jgi:hypothetical protein